MAEVLIGSHERAPLTVALLFAVRSRRANFSLHHFSPIQRQQLSPARCIPPALINRLQFQAREQEMKWGRVLFVKKWKMGFLVKKVEMGAFFVKKVENRGVFFCKKWTFPQRRVHYVQYQYFYFTFYSFGGCISTQRTPCLRAWYSDRPSLCACVRMYVRAASFCGDILRPVC